MNQTPTPTESSDGARRETILAAGERHFAARGFDGASTRAIAADVGLNQATLYHYYPTKQALYEAVVSQAVDALVPPLQRLAEQVEARPKQRLTEADLTGVVDRTVDYLEQHPQLARLVLRASLDADEGHGLLLAPALKPLFDIAVRILGAIRTDWERDELPLMTLSLLQLSLGHFASMSLSSQLLARDAASREALDQQKRFWRRFMVRLLLDPPAVTHNARKGTSGPSEMKR